MVNCLIYLVISLPSHTHTDHLGHQPQINKLQIQKGTFEHWFLNREKIHSEIYNGVHNYLNQKKHLRTFIYRYLGTAQPLKINIYVLVVIKTTQIGVSIKIQQQIIGHYRIIDTPTLVTYELKDFSGKQITRHRSNIVPYFPKKFFLQEQMETYFLDNSFLKLHPKNPPLTKSKTVSFSLDTLKVPSPQLTSNPSEIPEHTSKNYTTRNSRLRRQPIKD